MILESRERKRKIIKIFNDYFGIDLLNYENFLPTTSEEQIFIKLRKKHIKMIEDTAARVLQNFIKMIIKRNWWKKLVSKYIIN